MLEALLTRRGGALRSFFQRCEFKQQFLPSCSRGTESTMSRPRYMFSTSCRQLAAKQTRIVRKTSNSPSKPAQVVLSAIPPKTQAYTSFGDTLALRPSPTLLFQSSSHIGYLVGCYVLGGLCFGYSAINFNTFYLHPPEDVWKPIPIFICGLCAFMVGVGIFFFYRVSWSI